VRVVYFLKEKEDIMPVVFLMIAIALGGILLVAGMKLISLRPAPYAGISEWFIWGIMVCLCASFLAALIAETVEFLL